ncbi:hypothetical protein A2U01_0099076, partial [Trifolium medium]|nr:hypothetical protein [Trifolium medium]
MTRKEGADMVSSFLELGWQGVLVLFAEINGPHLKHTFVEAIYNDNRGFTDKAVAENKPVHE